MNLIDLLRRAASASPPRWRKARPGREAALTSAVNPGGAAGASRAAPVRRWPLIVIALALLALAGCQYPPHPHACDNHGGIRIYIKAIYYCHDGHTVGNGWLWLNRKEVAP